MASETYTGVTQLKIGDVCLLANERSERDTYRGKNEKIGDVCLLASERSERDSIRGWIMQNRVYVICSYICMWNGTYAL